MAQTPEVKKIKIDKTKVSLIMKNMKIRFNVRIAKYFADTRHLQFVNKEGYTLDIFRTFKESPGDLENTYKLILYHYDDDNEAEGIEILSLKYVVIHPEDWAALTQVQTPEEADVENVDVLGDVPPNVPRRVGGAGLGGGYSRNYPRRYLSHFVSYNQSRSRRRSKKRRSRYFK